MARLVDVTSWGDSNRQFIDLDALPKPSQPKAQRVLPLYKCPECGWVGTEDEMQADATGGEDEAWSNWICGHCHAWLRLEDYAPVASRDGSPETIPYEG